MSMCLFVPCLLACVAGKAFFIPTELRGEFVLRFAIGSSTTQLRHVQEAWATIQAVADVIVPSSNGGQAAAAVGVGSEAKGLQEPGSLMC